MGIHIENEVKIYSCEINRLLRDNSLDALNLEINKILNLNARHVHHNQICKIINTSLKLENNDFFTEIQNILNHQLKLRLNKNKTEVLKILSKFEVEALDKKQEQKILNFLGYEISIFRYKKPKDNNRFTSLRISNNKIIKIHSRINSAFEIYQTSPKSHSDFDLLFGRLKYLTGNIPIKVKSNSRKHKIIKGLYYTYKNVNIIEVMKQLDYLDCSIKFLIMKNNKSFTTTQRNLLYKLSFHENFNKFSLSRINIQDIQKILQGWY